MSVVAVPVAWPRACDFACHSAACRPPTSGGTGGSGVGAPSAKAIPGFYKYWWRLNGGSQALTDAAGEKLGIEGYGSDGADKGTRDAAESLLLAIGSQPVRRNTLYSGHTRSELSKVGDVVSIPLMSLAYSQQLARVYMSGGSGGGQHPLKRGGRGLWDKLSDKVKDLYGPPLVNGKVVGGSERLTGGESFRTLYVFGSHRSALIAKGKERVTSGRYKVTKVSGEPVKGEWVYDLGRHDFVEKQASVVHLEYVGVAR